MKKVVIFCANGLGEYVLNALDDTIFDVVAFADNDERRWGGNQAGIEIINPLNLKHMEYDYVIISYASYAEDIRKQLISLNVEPGKIIVFQENIGDIEWFESRIVLMRRCVSIMEERKIQGSVAEVGVYRGDFSMLLNRYMPDRKLFLFDTFEGFSEKDLQNENQLKESQKISFRDTSEQMVLGRMPHPENCIIRKGWFPDTAVGLDEEFCFVSLDTDLYKPIKEGLEYFYPRLVPGGYIFVHDFGTQDWNGVKKAVYEFSEETGASFFPLLDRAESVVFTK